MNLSKSIKPVRQIIFYSILQLSVQLHGLFFALLLTVVYIHCCYTAKLEG